MAVRGKVLIVEDDRAICNFIRRVLEANGLRVKLRLLDFFGREAEEETVTLREIEILEVGTQEEQMYAVLEELERERMTLLPPQDGESE